MEVCKLQKAAKDYIPGLGKLFKIDGNELDLVTYSNTGTTASIGASATLDVAITHAAVALNTVPEITLITANCTAAPVNVTSTGFTIRITNGAGAQAVNYSYSRTSLQP